MEVSSECECECEQGYWRWRINWFVYFSVATVTGIVIPNRVTRVKWKRNTGNKGQGPIHHGITEA